MFDHFPRLDIYRLESLSTYFSSYIGVAHDNGHGCAWVYEGSATSTSGGEASRMFNGHRVELRRGHNEIVRLRRSTKKVDALFVHEIMSAPETESFFVSITRYPQQSSHTLGLKVRLLATLSENLLMVLLGGCLPAPGKSPPRSLEWSALASLSQRLTVHVRPPDAPALPWYGTNKVLPIVQPCPYIWGLLTVSTQGRSCSTRWGHADRLLAEHWQKTGILQMSTSHADKILLEVGIDRTQKQRQSLRSLYARYLETQGQRYQTCHMVALKIFLVLWVAIIQRAEATGLVTGPLNGIYKVDEFGLD